MSTSWRSRVRRKIYSRLPQWLKKHDFELFAAVLSIFGGLPLAIGQAEPGSVDALLPSPLVTLWGMVLVIGGTLVILGVVFGAHRKFPDRAFWMRLEAVGLTGLAYFCYLYTICLWGVAPKTAWLGSLIILAFGITCHVREAAVLMKLEDYRLGLGLEERP